MTDTQQAGLLDTAINILVSPSEAFEQIRQRPTKLFPLALIVVSTVIALVWYFNIIDFAWYVDDTLANANIDENNIDDARDAMLSMSQNTFMLFGVIGGSLGTVVYYVLQSAYLALISALTGDGQKFSRWFSLVCWTALPSLLAIVGMLVTIALSPNGQLSAFDLNPLTLRNLGIETANDSLNTLFASINLTMVWSIGLLTLGYQQWQKSSLAKAIVVILAPYLLIASVWAYFALM
jgi:hypothetical protein